MQSISIIRLATLGIAVLAAPAMAKSPDLDGALLIEWMVANCDHSTLPAFTVMAAGMMINGSDQERVAERRKVVQAEVKKSYPNADVACVGLVASMKD